MIKKERETDQIIDRIPCSVYDQITKNDKDPTGLVRVKRPPAGGFFMFENVIHRLFKAAAVQASVLKKESVLFLYWEIDFRFPF